MKTSMFFKQEKPITPKVLGFILLLLTAVSLNSTKVPLSQIISMGAIGSALLGYSISYEICKEGVHFKHLKLFGLTVLKTELKSFNPDVIRAFPASFKSNFNWGPVAAMGKQNRTDKYVIRLFEGSRHFTIFKTSSFETASTRAKMLGEILQISTEVRK